MWPRSKCFSCGESLRPHDLIPVISYLLLKGKCRYCKQHIPYRYVLLEIVFGITPIIVFSYFGFTLATLEHSIFFMLLLLISVVDLETETIRHRFLYFGIAWLLLFNGFSLNGLIGALTGGILFFLIAYLSKGGMGGGDIKLIALLGYGLGWPYILISIWFALIAGALAAMLALCFKKDRKSRIPFAPFLSAGYIITVFYGSSLLDWYMASFF